MKKSDVSFHRDGCCGMSLPAINVKCREFGGGITSEELGCSRKVFDQAMEFAFASACRRFWEDAGEMVSDVFPGAAWAQEGRSGGWLVVDGLPSVDSWDARVLAKWAKLCRLVEGQIRFLSGHDEVKEEILANRWNEEGSEFHNFFDRPDGTTVCISELKRAAVAAGFGEVIRK